MASPWWRVTIALALGSMIGCGRLGFDPVGSVDDGGTDGRLDDGRVADSDRDSAPPPACRTDVRYNGEPSLASTYRVVSVDTSWTDAKADCELDGAHLPIVDDANEAASLLIGDWIGITDEALENEWRTIDGDLATFLPWGAGEPDGGDTENCGRLDDATQTFESRSCLDLRDYSCECE